MQVWAGVNVMATAFVGGVFLAFSDFLMRSLREIGEPCGSNAMKAINVAVFRYVFIPMFMLVGISPELTQAAYRIGDSVSNTITPLNAYLVIVLVFMRQVAPKAGMGTLISTMLPYTIVFSIVWTILLLTWMALGLDLGIGGPLEYQLPPACPAPGSPLARDAAVSGPASGPLRAPWGSESLFSSPRSSDRPGGPTPVSGVAPPTTGVSRPAPRPAGRPDRGHEPCRR